MAFAFGRYLLFDVSLWFWLGWLLPSVCADSWKHYYIVHPYLRIVGCSRFLAGLIYMEGLFCVEVCYNLTVSFVQRNSKELKGVKGEKLVMINE